MEAVDLMPIRSHARWHFDVKQSKPQWAEYMAKALRSHLAQSYVRLALRNDALASAADANGFDRHEHPG